MDTGLLIWAPLVLAVFACFWMGIVWLISRLSGWGLLAKQFRHDDPFLGRKWNWESGAMRGVGIRGCLTVGADKAGLYLAMQPLFRIGHPPLFIPWTHITVRPKKFIFLSGMEFQLGAVPLWLRASVAEELRRASL